MMRMILRLLLFHLAADFHAVGKHIVNQCVGLQRLTFGGQGPSLALRLVGLGRITLALGGGGAGAAAAGRSGRCCFCPCRFVRRFRGGGSSGCPLPHVRTVGRCVLVLVRVVGRLLARLQQPPNEIVLFCNTQSRKQKYNTRQGYCRVWFTEYNLSMVAAAAAVLTLELHLPLAHRFHLVRVEIAQVVILVADRAGDLECGQPAGCIPPAERCVRTTCVKMERLRGYFICSF